MFDDPNLVSSAGLVPVMRLAERAGLGQLADQHLTVPTDKGANAGLKVASLVAGMVAGADSIDDMAMLRLVEADYAWVTGEIKAIADRHAKGRIVSALEGGYALGALGRSAAEHIRELLVAP